MRRPGRAVAAGTFANCGDRRPALRRYCAALDSASALSLPIELRAFAFGEIDKRPILRLRHQSFTHRILQNVFRFVASTLLASQSVFEEIPLPGDFNFFGSPFFP